MIKNKNSFFIILGALLLAFVLPILLVFITDNIRYNLILLKIFNILIFGASIIYTYVLFNKQIIYNTMFGITRKETHKKWKLKIIVAGTGIFLINMLNSILSYFLILKENNLRDAIVMGFTYFEGFYSYFIFNFLMFFISSLNIKMKNKKTISLLIFIIGLIICIVFSVLSFINILQDLIKVLIVLDIFVGIVIFILGLLLILFINKNIYKGEY